MSKIRLNRKLVVLIVSVLLIIIIISIIALNINSIERNKEKVVNILQDMEYINHNKDLMELRYSGHCSDDFYNETYEERLNSITEEEELVEYINATILEIEDYYPYSGYDVNQQCEENSLNEAMNELSEIVSWFNEESVYEEEYYNTEEYQKEKERMLERATEGSLVYELIKMDSYRGRILETNNSGGLSAETSSTYSLSNTDYADDVLEQLEGSWEFESIPFGGMTVFPSEPNLLKEKGEVERKEGEKEHIRDEFEIKDNKLYYDNTEYYSTGMYLDYRNTDLWGHQGAIGSVDKIGNTGINFGFENEEEHISLVYTDFDELYVIDPEGNSEYGYTYYLRFEKK